jgi:hypothetical protein
MEEYKWLKNFGGDSQWKMTIRVAEKHIGG